MVVQKNKSGNHGHRQECAYLFMQLVEELDKNVIDLDIKFATATTRLLLLFSNLHAKISCYVDSSLINLDPYHCATFRINYEMSVWIFCIAECG